MNRRSFLRGGLVLLAAPAIVRVASIMPVRAEPGFTGFESRIPGWMIMNPKDWAALFPPGSGPLFDWVTLDPPCPVGHQIMGDDTAHAP